MNDMTRAEQLKELSNNWVKSMREYNMSLATALIEIGRAHV